MNPFLRIRKQERRNSRLDQHGVSAICVTAAEIINYFRRCLYVYVCVALCVWGGVCVYEYLCACGVTLKPIHTAFEPSKH